MSADGMLLEPPTPVRLTDVQREDRTPEWLTYHRLVVDESRGIAPKGSTELLALDPYRWAAHLGCAAGDITDQLRSRPNASDAWRRSANHARSMLTARKADVVAIRKRDILHRAARASHERVGLLLTAVRAVREAAEAGDYDRVVAIASAAIDLEGNLDSRRQGPAPTAAVAPSTTRCPAPAAPPRPARDLTGPDDDDLRASHELARGQMVKAAGEWFAVREVTVAGDLILDPGEGKPPTFYAVTDGERFAWHEGAF